MAHIIQTVTVLLILQPSPHKPGKHLGFGPELLGFESSCDTASGGCMGATKAKGSTPGLGSPRAANLWWLGKYIRETHHHTWSSFCPSSYSPEHY